MSTHLPGFHSFSSVFLHHYVLAELATSRRRVRIFFECYSDWFVGYVESLTMCALQILLG